MAVRFCKTFAFLLMLVAGPAFAGITLLSPTPQRAYIGETFPPLAARFTDAAGNPLANARVHYAVNQGGGVDTPTDPDCFEELGIFCNVTTDAQGIARTHALRAARAATKPTTVGFYRDGSAEVVTAELFIDPVVPPMTLTVVSGSGQSTVVGTAFAQLFVVRVLSSSGVPVAGVTVLFRSVLGPAFDFNGTNFVRAVTDANGIASAAPRVSMGIGPGTFEALVDDPAANMTITTTFAYYSTSFDGRSDLDLEDMWWGGPQENGWGISIAQRSDRLFPVLYTYDESGNPTWRVFAQGYWIFNARYEHYRARQFKPKGSPYYAYDASRFILGSGTSDAALRFGSEQAATLQLFRDFPGTQDKALVRQDFGPGVPPRMPGVGGMWWGGPSQAGWGISLMEQPGGLFGVWFTYDANGDPLWFVMPTGAWENDTTYSGVLYKTHSSPWFDVAYDPSRLQVTAVGTFRFRFVNLDNATFEWTSEGHAGTVPILRTEF